MPNLIAFDHPSATNSVDMSKSPTVKTFALNPRPDFKPRKITDTSIDQIIKYSGEPSSSSITNKKVNVKNAQPIYKEKDEDESGSHSNLFVMEKISTGPKTLDDVQIDNENL